MVSGFPGKQEETKKKHTVEGLMKLIAAVSRWNDGAPITIRYQKTSDGLGMEYAVSVPLCTVGDYVVYAYGDELIPALCSLSNNVVSKWKEIADNRQDQYQKAKEAAVVYAEQFRQVETNSQGPYR